MPNYKPEIASLLRMMRDEGFTLLHVDNGEEEIALPAVPGAMNICLEHVMSVDTSIVWWDEKSDSTPRWAMLVVGNDYGELVADYGCNATPSFRKFDKVIREHSDRWSYIGLKKMRKQFQDYELVRQSGVINMYDAQGVGDMVGMSKREVRKVAEYYSDLKEVYHNG